MKPQPEAKIKFFIKKRWATKAMKDTWDTDSSCLDTGRDELHTTELPSTLPQERSPHPALSGTTSSPAKGQIVCGAGGAIGMAGPLMTTQREGHCDQLCKDCPAICIGHHSLTPPVPMGLSATLGPDITRDRLHLHTTQSVPPGFSLDEAPESEHICNICTRSFLLYVPESSCPCPGQSLWTCSSWHVNPTEFCSVWPAQGLSLCNFYCAYRQFKKLTIGTKPHRPPMQCGW